MKHYACMDCPTSERSTFKFKGLCRSCTEYGSDGEVITPVYRIRTDEYGNPVRHIRAERPTINRSGIPQRVGFREARKPTKKELQGNAAMIAEEVPVPEMVEIIAGGEEE